MGMITNPVLAWSVKVLIGVAALIYASLVLMTYSTDGPRYRARLRLAEPLRSTERLLIWMGVRALSLLIAAGRAALAVLGEASAEVGEWLVSRRNREAPAGFRSHVL